MTLKRRKCRARNPDSKTASPFMDYWYKLCCRWKGHKGDHQDSGGIFGKESWPNTTREPQERTKP